MALVTFNGPIASISGQIDKDSNFYFMTRNGKTYMCRKGNKRASKPKPNEQKTPLATLSKVDLNRIRFGIAYKIANEIDKSTYLRAQFAHTWNKRQYATLKGYIMNFIYHHDHLSLDV